MPDESSQDRGLVEELIDDFYRSMDEQDLEAFSALNARDEDVVHVGTDRGERWIGWDVLRRATIEQFEALESFEVSYRERRVKMIGGGDVACFSQVMDLKADGDGSSTHLEHARLTGVAEKRRGRWVLVQTHLSLPA